MKYRKINHKLKKNDMNEIIDLYFKGVYDVPKREEISDNEYYLLHPDYFDCPEKRKHQKH